MNQNKSFDYEQLSPKIRNAVRWFHALSWETTDSGDGSNYTAGMDCALPMPMVVACSTSADLAFDAKALYEDLERALGEEHFETIEVQAMYNPRDGVASLLVTGEGLLHLQVSKSPLCGIPM